MCLRSSVTTVKVKVVMLLYMMFGGVDWPEGHQRWTAEYENCWSEHERRALCTPRNVEESAQTRLDSSTFPLM